MKKGTKVKPKYLGKGIFIKHPKKLEFFSIVKWDKTPNKRYNLGENPCLIFTDTLKMR